MELKQKVHIPLPPGDIWKALNDPDVLRRSLPGCESFEAVDERHFNLAMLVKVGPVKATFNGEVKLEDVDAPRAYTLVGAGKGGVAGFARGSANVELTPMEDDAATLMIYDVNVAVGGKLAQIGSRLINSAARKMAAEFFENFVSVACGADTSDADEVHVETIISE